MTKHLLVSLSLFLTIFAFAYNAEAKGGACPTGGKCLADGSGQVNRGNNAKAPKKGQNGSGTCKATSAAVSPLTSAEIETLKYMHEEEKVAKDLYAQFLAAWGNNVFVNIKSAEANHQAQLANALTKHGIDDSSVESNAPGVFNNATLQQLYNSLLQQGSVSAVSALTVSALVEETNISDLSQAINTATAADLKQIYSNLLSASKNHLRAFILNLSALGVTYSPQLLSQSAVDQILNTRPGKKR